MTVIFHLDKVRTAELRREDLKLLGGFLCGSLRLLSDTLWNNKKNLIPKLERAGPRLRDYMFFF